MTQNGGISTETSDHINKQKTTLKKKTTQICALSALTFTCDVVVHKLHLEIPLHQSLRRCVKQLNNMKLQ